VETGNKTPPAESLKQVGLNRDLSLRMKITAPHITKIVTYYVEKL